MNTEHSCVDYERSAVLKKPPLGVKPFVLIDIPRINDLLAGIGRYINETNLTRDELACAKLWAKELEERLDLMDTMLIYE